MKTKAILLFAATPLLYAGTPDPVTTPNGAGDFWITPTIDMRARYEFADVDGLDPSHAFTTRERVGLKTKAWNGFSGVIEGEFTQAIIDDYSSGPQNGAGVNVAGVDPFEQNNSPIYDPETNELNQLYGQYKGYDTVLKLGRQKIIYDNAAFIGNVGWRQNEQTYDGVSAVNTSIDGLTLSAAYINQVNRIFGSDALAQFRNAPADIYLLNGSYKGVEGITLGAYAYLMDFDASADQVGGIGQANKWDNNTFGVSATGNAAGLLLYGELAYQEKAGNLNDREALYGHFTATKKFGKQALTLGLEHLDAGFQTPLATVHAFNGFADGTDTGRLDGNHNGLTDLYLTHALPVAFGMKWVNTLHALGDNEISTGYGYEIDSVLSKKFDDHLTVLAKLAHFESQGDAYVGKAAIPTIDRFSMELVYTF